MDLEEINVKVTNVDLVWTLVEDEENIRQKDRLKYIRLKQQSTTKTRQPKTLWVMGSC